MSREQVIVYNGTNGKCRVVIPAFDCALADDAVIAKDVPTSEYSVVNSSDLPNKIFREAWIYNHSSSTVDVDLASAKEICKKSLETKFLQIRTENQETTALAEMKGESPSLKDNPAVPYSTIDAATTVAELEALV